MERKYIERFVEFFVIGFLIGIAEDLIVITLSTGAIISWRIVGIAAFVALPFAAFSELIVDRKDLFDFFKRKVKEEAREIKKIEGKIKEMPGKIKKTIIKKKK